MKAKKFISLLLTVVMAISLCSGLAVTVSAASVTVSLPDKSVTLEAGKSVTLKPTVKGVKKYTLVWSTSDKSIATVSKDGKVTGVKSGSADITVKVKGTKASASVKVKVTAAKAAAKTPAKTESKPAKKTTTAKASSNFNTKKTAFDITREMKAGWNLGNSLDAIGSSGTGSETSWGNPKTTKKMIDDIKKAGFTSVRIPVSWGNHCNAEGIPDKEWLDRVQEVVDYAYNNGMYVILNSHHDNSYYKIGDCAANDKELEKSVKKMRTLWTNIAKRFKGYSEKLVFETLNEPRTEGSKNEWTGGTAAEREVVYRLNCEITDAIRATGGSNAYRYIMMPAYAATSSTNILRQMKLPDDDRVIVSVHAYSPYNFALNGKGSSEFKDSDKKELDRFFNDLNSIFITEGRAVVIGECGATNKDNESDRCEWAKYFVSGAQKYGIPCFLWDNNAVNGKGDEKFGYYNRNKGEFAYPEFVNAFISAAK